MAKLPWYIKDNGTEFINGSAFMNIKVRRIYIIWVKIQVFFTLLLDAAKQFLNSIGAVRLSILMVIAFFVFLGLIIEICHLIGWVLEKLFG